MGKENLDGLIRNYELELKSIEQSKRRSIGITDREKLIYRALQILYLEREELEHKASRLNTPKATGDKLLDFDIIENEKLIDLISDYVLNIPNDAIPQKANLDGIFLSDKKEIKNRVLKKCCLLLADVLQKNISFKEAKTKIRSLIFGLTNDSNHIYIKEQLADTFDLLEAEISQKKTVNKFSKESHRLSELAIRYCKKPRSKYNREEVLFILKKADEFKHQENVSALIRTIQNDEYCPDSIKDKGKFNHSNKHVKRQRKVIRFYDKETGNKRN